jgi:hypothetical protein
MIGDTWKGTGAGGVIHSTRPGAGRLGVALTVARIRPVRGSRSALSPFSGRATALAARQYAADIAAALNSCPGTAGSPGTTTSRPGPTPHDP